MLSSDAEQTQRTKGRRRPLQARGASAGEEGAVLPELMLADGTPCQVPLSETNGWRKGRGVTTSNIPCQIHLNNLSLPAVTDTNCRGRRLVELTHNGTRRNSLN